MGLFERMNEDVKAAMKAGRKEEVGIYRMLLSEVKNVAIEMRSRDDVTDEIVIAALVKAVKRRLDAARQYREAGREEAAAKEEHEIEIASRYLPEELSDEELGRMVGEAIVESGAESPSDMGKVMKIVMPRTKGRADGNKVRRMVTERLGG